MSKGAFESDLVARLFKMYQKLAAWRPWDYRTCFQVIKGISESRFFRTIAVSVLSTMR